MAIEPWRRRNIEHGLTVLRSMMRDQQRNDAERERALSEKAGCFVHMGANETAIFLADAISFLEASLMDGPDNYEILADLPRTFIAELDGRTVRCHKAEHVNVGRGWMLSVDGVSRTVSENELSNPRAE